MPFFATRRVFIRLAAAVVLATILILLLPNILRHTVSTPLSRPQSCNVVSVTSAPETCEPIAISLFDVTCRWTIRVTSAYRPSSHALLTSDGSYTVKQLAQLRQLESCKSARDCGNTTLACAYGVEDPSDAFWLREYEFGTKFVVIFKIGFMSLLFFIASIISDGSIFFPHRTGFSVFTGSVLVLIGISSLLYVLIVPKRLQLSLYGSGPLQSVGYIVLVTTIAAVLPGAAVIWVNTFVFVVFFIGFLLEQLAYVTIGIVYFLGVLFAYQAEITLLHLNLIYQTTAMDETLFDQRLVAMSERFLIRVRRNWFLRHIPRALDEDALQIISNLLPDHLLEEVLREEVPRIEFEELETSTPSQSRDSNRPTTSNDETTPLLNSTVAP